MAAHLIASLLVLAIVGFIDSVYIYWHHVRKKPLVCPLNENCSAVVESKWGSMLGIKNEILGALYYLIIALLTIMIFIQGIQILFSAMLIISSLALISSLFLVYVQKYILKQYCFYCLISALVNLLIFLNALLLQ